MGHRTSELSSFNKPLSASQVVRIIRDRGWRLSKRPLLSMLGFGEYSSGYRVTALTPEHIEYMSGFTVMVHWENGPPASSYRGLYELQNLQGRLEQLGFQVDFPGPVLYAKQMGATSRPFNANTVSRSSTASQHS